MDAVSMLYVITCVLGVVFYGGFLRRVGPSRFGRRTVCRQLIVQVSISLVILCSVKL